MRPAEVPELYFARPVIQNILLLVDILFGRLRTRLVEFRHIVAALGRGQPARRFEALQFVGHALERQRRRASLRPEQVAVKVIAVMVRVEHVLHRLLRNAFGIGQGRAGATGEVGIHYDQEVLHLDDHVVAVALVHIALAKPHAGRNQTHGFRVGAGARNQ